MSSPKQLNFQSYSLLIVDDNPTNLAVVVDYLEDYGFKVMVARNGHTGLKRAKLAKPDLILLDVMMAGIDGFETCRRLKADPHTAEIPVIFMTALANTQDKVTGFQVGAVDYLTKPIQHEELLARVTTHLRIRDLTEHLEHLVEERTAELTKANQELERLLFVMAHDLKEPLRTVQWFTDLLVRRYGTKLDQKGQDYQKRVLKAARRSVTMLDHLQTLSRLRQVEPPSQKIAADVIVKEVLEQLDGEIKQTNAKIHVAPTLPELPISLTWGSKALYHLISNALKYSIIDDKQNQAPEIEIASYRTKDEENRKIGLVVKDRGPGIPPEYMEKIWELFQRAVGRQIAGTGAGLAIVRQIAERHGGQAWVKNREGGGAEFIITFGE